MSTPTLIQSKSTERLVLAIGLLLIIGPAALLGSNIQITDRFFPSRDLLSLSPIGEVIRPSRIVRRKGEDESAFTPTRSGDPLFVGDTIITGKESSTQITLSDGNTLELSAESMIRIEPVRSFSFKGIEKKLLVTIQAGTVKAKVKPNSVKMTLQSPSGKILKEIAPPSAPVSPQQKPGKIVSAVDLSDPDPGLFDGSTYETVSLPPPPAEVVSAKSASTSLAPAPAPEGLAKPSTFTPEFLRRPEAYKLVAEFLSQLKPVQSEEPAPSLPEKPILSKFVAPFEPVPVIEVAPVTSLITDQAELKDQQFTFKWKDGGIRIALPYSLKIEHKAETLSFESEVTEYHWNLPYEVEGQIRWWVEAKLKDGGKVRSKKQDASWKLPVPVLASPGNGLELPEFYVKGESHEVLLTWKQVQICKSFEVQVSTASDFKEVVFKEKTKKNFETFPVEKPGTYFWRVGCNYTQDFKGFSAPFSFKLTRLK